MRKLGRTVASQFAASPTLRQLIDSINQWLDPRQNFEAFYDKVWNIDTAVGFGLDYWGRIVGIDRVLQVGVQGSFFGWGEAGDRTGWDQSPFYEARGITTNFALSDEAFRRLILAKAAQNITDSSIPSINALLMFLFPGRGNAFVTDGNNAVGPLYFGWGEPGDRADWGHGPWIDFAPTLPGNMTMIYTFLFPLSLVDLAIVSSGVLPKPTGVRASVSYTGLLG